MAVGSPFLEHLFDDPLPPGTGMHVVYGTGAAPGSQAGPGDGTIGLASLSRAEALAEATSVSVFEDLLHGDIALSPEVHETIAGILDTATPPP
jgi:hypothetical protein